MLLGDINFILLLFFFMFTSFTININTSLHFLLTAEFLWITLYILVLLIGLIFNNINLLSLTFFFLILSAVEFGLGLVLILIQNILLRSINLNYNVTNDFKFTIKFFNKIKFLKNNWYN